MDIGNGMSPADFAAVMNGNRGGFGGGGYGGFGDGAWWIIILFLFAMNGGWGNRGGGGYGGGSDIPYIVNSTNNDVQRGFDQQSVMNGLNGLTTAVSNGFANAEVSRCNSQTNLLQTLNANQNANTAAMNQIAMSLQNSCFENRAGLADLKYTVATENCADRQAISDGLRDVIANNTANTNALMSSITSGIQAIKDDLCQDRLDAANRQIAQLQTQLNMANLAASQSAQTAQLIQDNNAQTAALIQRIAPAPTPSYTVPNPYTGCCGNQSFYGGCGCSG